MRVASAMGWRAGSASPTSSWTWTTCCPASASTGSWPKPSTPCDVLIAVIGPRWMEPLGQRLNGSASTLVDVQFGGATMSRPIRLGEARRRNNAQHDKCGVFRSSGGNRVTNCRPVGSSRITTALNEPTGIVPFDGKAPTSSLRSPVFRSHLRAPCAFAPAPAVTTAPPRARKRRPAHGRPGKTCRNHHGRSLALMISPSRPRQRGAGDRFWFRLPSKVRVQTALPPLADTHHARSVRRAAEIS
jgi:hypothetical protein